MKGFQIFLSYRLRELLDGIQIEQTNIQPSTLPNTYFQFKQFKINQDKSSMKVCTDSCLFGAWVADKIEKKIIKPKNILDIGSGTGLLGLMIAQKSRSIIDAVEIDKNSFLQSKENFMSSPWNQQLQAFHADIKAWRGALKYDLIISNPPFFENDLRSVDRNRNLAKHHDGLTFSELLQSVKNNIRETGDFAVLIPFHRMDYFKTIAFENNFYLKEELLVKQTSKHSYFRVILFFGTKHKSVISNGAHFKSGGSMKQLDMQSSNELIINNEEGNYTDAFHLLLKDYYFKNGL